jgi:hypothetical protein
MTETPAEAPAPVTGPFASSLYRLVAEKLPDSTAASPIEFILARRETTEEQSDPMAYTRIANALSAAAGVYVSHEAIRRWHRAHLEASDAPDIETATSGD